MATRIVFMGSPEFALPSLRALALSSYPILGVVTQPDRPAGRGRELTPPPVKRLALELGIPVMQPERLKQPEAMAQLQEWAPELIVVAAFGQILRPAVLDLPQYGCINVHASLLPRWRGAAPIQAALLHGDAESGVTIMRMDPGIDTGAMLSQRSTPIQPDDDAELLSRRLSELGAQLLIETLPGYLDGTILPQPQDESRATYASMLKKEDGELDFSQPAESLARRVRAFTPWPGAYICTQGRTFKILQAHAVDTSGIAAGHRTVVDGLPAIGTAQGVLLLDIVQPAGKKPMPGKAFLQGARDWASGQN
jgi:methionyl-tRNA formyltransferase